MMKVKQENCEHQFFKCLVWPDRESKPSQTVHYTNIWSVSYEHVITENNIAKFGISVDTDQKIVRCNFV